MKIFKSLNCEVCEAPFAPVANQPRSPRYLGCGRVMCDECYETEKSTNKKERKHQCNSGVFCFLNSRFAYFLIDVISQDSLKLSPKGDGYLLCKPFKVPECPICHDESEFHFKLIDFLTELPEMTRQLEEMSITAYHFCQECIREQPVDDMFYCEDCEKKICATCVVKKHKAHKTPALLEMEATKLSDQLQRISINEVNTYKNLFPGLHKELVNDIGAFGTKLISKEENLKLASNYEDLQKKHEKCIKFKTEFEAICKEYMPHLRECDTKVKDLIKSLDDGTN